MKEPHEVDWDVEHVAILVDAEGHIEIRPTSEEALMEFVRVLERCKVTFAVMRMEHKPKLWAFRDKLVEQHRRWRAEDEADEKEALRRKALLSERMKRARSQRGRKNRGGMK